MGNESDDEDDGEDGGDEEEEEDGNADEEDDDDDDEESDDEDENEDEDEAMDNVEVNEDLRKAVEKALGDAAAKDDEEVWRSQIEMTMIYIIDFLGWCGNGWWSNATIRSIDCRSISFAYSKIFQYENHQRKTSSSISCFGSHWISD